MRQERKYVIGLFGTKNSSDRKSHDFGINSIEKPGMPSLVNLSPPFPDKGFLSSFIWFIKQKDRNTEL